MVRMPLNFVDCSQLFFCLLAGTYSGTVGFGDVGTCLQCAAGEFGPVQSPTFCPLSADCSCFTMTQNMLSLAGTYSTALGATAIGTCVQCPAGNFCVAGSGTDGVACGSVDKFCPAGSGSPSDVQSGYYTTGGTETTRTGESQCEAGTWCSGGVRAECVAGRV